jgi:enamine deaminase RidA (YjgF/YER057c/UK114 family)
VQQRGSLAHGEKWWTGGCRAVVRYPFVYVSQATALDLSTNAIPIDPIEQITSIWEILKRVLAQADSSLLEIVRCNYYVTREQDTHPILRVCGEVLADVRPAMTMVVVPALSHPDALVSIDVIAMSNHRAMPSFEI